MDTWDDATWILTSTFIIFTMQSGFGLLESGSVNRKNETNIMVKNSVDVIFGSISYWLVGYGISFGDNSFYGLFGRTKYLLDTRDSDTLGHIFAHFFFQSSFATTATTIVSGSVAERANFLGYIVFSFLNTFVYAFPAHWIWHEDGFLTKHFGAIDFAGSGAVHLVGGVTALVAAIMIGPRSKRWTHPEKFQMDSPINALLGLFMLWWGWLGFNCGSTYGVAGGKWKLASKAAVTTINGSIGGGIVAFVLTFLLQKGKFDVGWVINGILGGLVAITSFCPVMTPGEALIIGGIGALVVIMSAYAIEALKIDDPVGAVAVHGGAGVWSLVAVGLFAGVDPTDEQLFTTRGLIHGGGFQLLGGQCVYIVCCCVWSGVCTFLSMKVIDMTIGIRCSYAMEVFGADMMEHNVGGYFDHRTKEVFNSRREKVGVITKDMTESEVDILYTNFLISGHKEEQKLAAEYPMKLLGMHEELQLVEKKDLPKVLQEGVAPSRAIAATNPITSVNCVD